MKIKSIKAFPIAITVTGGIKISLAELTLKEHMVVKITTDEGITGYGEVGVLAPEIGGTLEGLVETVNNYFASELTGYDPFNIEAINSAMDKAVYGYHFAKAAVDIACYDIMGKALDLPLYKLIGGNVNNKIPLTWVLWIDKVEKNVNEAEKALKNGYSTLKVKVGENAEDDIKRIEAIRGAVGDKMSIRIDANQGYRPKEAIKTLRRMEKFDIQCVEQPVDKLNIKGLAQVAQSTEIPVMTDEAVYSFEDLIRVIEYNAASIINIKLARVGGITKAKKIANIAEAAGLSCMLGCMLELGVGIAAGAHVAISTPNVNVESDLIGHLYHEEDIIESSGESYLAVEDGCLQLPEEPGLGVKVKENIFEKFRVKKGKDST